MTIFFTHQYRGHTATFTLLQPLTPEPALWQVELCGHTALFTTRQWDEDNIKWVLKATSRCS